MALGLVILTAIIALALMWRFGRLSLGATYVTGAALALGLVGYSLQGSPHLPAAPVAPKVSAPPKAENANEARGALIGKVGNDADVLAQADAYFRINRPDLAARVIQGALDKNPNNPALWTGLGNALVGHGEGVLSPAAEYCYKRALKIAPEYPGALYFYAVALAQNDRAKDAQPVFQRLVETIPPAAPFRAQLIDGLLKSGLLSQKSGNLRADSK